MKFEEAIAEFKKGKLIKFRNEILYHDKTDNWIFGMNQELIMSNEWEVLEEPGKTFDHVLEDFKNGKKIRRTFWHPVKIMVIGLSGTSLQEEDILANDWEVLSE